MNFKEFWNKEIEVDFSGILNKIKKWFRGILNIFSKPDETIYLPKNNRPKKKSTFDIIDKGFDVIDRGFDIIDIGFDKVDDSINAMEKRFDKLISKIESRGTNETGPR